MKKIYALIAALGLVVGVTAQNARQMSPRLTQQMLPANNIGQAALATGDTLMYMPLLGYFINPTDSQAFDITTEDLDGLTNAYSMATWTDFSIFYTTDTWHFLPWETDTANYMWAATSWFSPAGQADQYLEFGPVTIPSSGATLRWYVKTNPAYRDGYEVLASTIGMTYGDFIDPAIYSRADCYNCGTNNDALDTMWQPVSITIPSSYNGQAVYFAFHHNAIDQDVLYLDEILITEGGTTGAEEITSISHLTNIPNPASTSTTISYGLNENANVSVSILDVTGKQVKNFEFGNQAAGTHQFSLDLNDMDAGIYFYSLTTGDSKVTRKLNVVK